MKLLTLAGFVACVLSTTACSGVAQEAPTAATPPTTAAAPAPAVQSPSGIVKGTVKMMRGYSFGYVAPKEGQKFELSLNPPGQTHPKLTFNGVADYIPFPRPFSVVEVDPRKATGGSDWRSLRAVYREEKGGHKVTLDVFKYPGTGQPDTVVAWVLIEYRNRIIGVAELHGLYTYTAPQK